MLKRYGEKAKAECVTRRDELAAVGDDDGVAVWRRIADAVMQLANTTPPGRQALAAAGASIRSRHLLGAA
jgi:hypothetical protein